MDQPSEKHTFPTQNGDRGERHFAAIAASFWNSDDMHLLSASNQTDSLPQEFGAFELFSEPCTEAADNAPLVAQENPLIAKVDATLDRTTGKLTVTEVDGNAQHKKGDKMSIQVWSGNEQYGSGYEGGLGGDGRYDNLENKGPIPKGEYLIGNKYKNTDLQNAHPGGDADWYKLYGADGKGGYSYDQLENGRGGFNFHTGLTSDGCVTAPSERNSNDTHYPASSKYNVLKEFLDSTKPYEYKPGDTYRGFLHVK